ncbi:MAG: hypothetical protein E7299_07235 [Lachnospiraceae bacterium]|nr:hypothetical protein [Lachnospiraceae bacterium]
MREVKKYRFIFLIISVCVLIGMVIGYDHSNVLSISVNENGSLRLRTSNEWEKIEAWEKEGVHYLFIPSYLENAYITYENGRLQWNTEETPETTLRISWDETLELVLRDEAGAIVWKGQTCFMKSDNIPALHIEMDDMELENVLSDKAYKGAANITLVEANGKVDYQGGLKYISGRGNSTWIREKKPFSLQLNSEYPLLGMESGDSWVLIANVYEGTKIAYKMTLDIAREMGMDYVSEMEWVDVYINGDYQGNYLLAEKLTVGDGRVEIEDMNKPNEVARGDVIPETFVDNYNKGYETDKNPENITGGYLIEKDLVGYYEFEKCGFFTNRLQAFSIKHPSMATRAEADYITEFVKAIDDLMATRNEAVLQFIDRESFYQKYLVDEISLNSDCNVTSAYFYKHRDENVLYAGPPWDYDNSYGDSQGEWLNYTHTILDLDAIREAEGFSLDWNVALLSFEICHDEVVQEYERVLPIYVYYLDKGIDEYKETIYDSIQMDMTRWDYGKYQAGYYYDYNNTIRYLKYFLTNRLACLNEQWGIACELPPLETRDIVHKVYVQVGDETTVIEVSDGQCVSEEELPELSEEYRGYLYERDKSAFSSYLPIYEDQWIVANVVTE